MRLTTSYDVRHPAVMAWVRFVPGAWLVVLTGLLCSIGDWWGQCFSCPPGSPFGSGGAYYRALRTNYAGTHQAGMGEFTNVPDEERYVRSSSGNCFRMEQGYCVEGC